MQGKEVVKKFVTRLRARRSGVRLVEVGWMVCGWDGVHTLLCVVVVGGGHREAWRCLRSEHGPG